MTYYARSLLIHFGTPMTSAKYWKEKDIKHLE